MTRRPRPLRTSDAQHVAALLRTLADELEAPHATAVQAAIRTALDIGYPATTSSNPTSGGETTTSRPEALTITPDRAAIAAHALLDNIHHLTRVAHQSLAGLQSWRPDRRIRSCPRCTHPIADGQSICRRMIDGRRCGTCREPDCPREGKPLETGEKMRDGRCHACDERQRRRARSTAPTSNRVASVRNLQEGVSRIIVDQGDQQ